VAKRHAISKQTICTILSAQRACTLLRVVPSAPGYVRPLSAGTKTGVCTHHFKLLAVRHRQLRTLCLTRLHASHAARRREKRQSQD
jgi:hypothetical protein